MSKIDENEFSNKGRIRAGFEKIGDGRPDGGASNIKRLSPKEEEGRINGGTRNVAATLVLRGYDGADSTKQEQLLTEFARANDFWFTVEAIEEEFGQEFFEKLNEKLGEKAAKSGAEAAIYRYDDKHLLKVIRYDVWDTRPLGFLDNRIALHNHLFPETFYELIGFCRGKGGKFSFVIKQPYIRGSEPTDEEIELEMKNRGYSKDYIYDTKYNSDDGNYIINDLHTGNWIKGFNEKMYCIDPAPCLGLKRKYGNIL